MKHKTEIIFENLFKENFFPLIYYAQKHVHDLDTSKEIVHNIFFNLWEKHEKIDWKNCMRSYLYTATQNSCINYLRDNKKFDRNEGIIEKIDEHANVDIIDPICKMEMQTLIKTSIDKLPEKCRKIFILNRFDNMKYSEIAEKLDISVKTVETQISKALKKMRKELSEYL